MKLDQKGQIMAEYVWVDADGETRSKSRVSPILTPSNSGFHPKPPILAGIATEPLPPSGHSVIGFQGPRWSNQHLTMPTQVSLLPT